MTGDTATTEDVQLPDPEDLDYSDPRWICDQWDLLLDEEDLDFDVRVEVKGRGSEDSDLHDFIENLYSNTVGHLRGIVGRDQYIPGGVYWDLVSEYSDEVIETIEEDPEWADDDLMILGEIVMPTEMSRIYQMDPAASFWTLMYSHHKAEGWVHEYIEDYFGYQDLESFAEWLEDKKGWKRVLSQMAYAACLQDVAQEVRQEGYDLDLGPYEYER